LMGAPGRGVEVRHGSRRQGAWISMLSIHPKTYQYICLIIKDKYYH